MSCRWYFPSVPISVSTPLVGSCSSCLDCYSLWSANQAVTIVKYFECHPWHLPKFSYGVLDSQDCHKTKKNKLANWMNPLGSEKSCKKDFVYQCLTQYMPKVLNHTWKVLTTLLPFFQFQEILYLLPSILCNYCSGNTIFEKKWTSTNHIVSVSESSIFLQTTMLMKICFKRNIEKCPYLINRWIYIETWPSANYLNCHMLSFFI